MRVAHFLEYVVNARHHGRKGFTARERHIGRVLHPFLVLLWKTLGHLVVGQSLEITKVDLAQTLVYGDD
jgi:hypothetical protein